MDNKLQSTRIDKLIYSKNWQNKLKSILFFFLFFQFTNSYGNFPSQMMQNLQDQIESDLHFALNGELSISLSPQNCTGNNPFTAEWLVTTTYTNAPIGDLVYQRNSETPVTIAQSSSPQTFIIPNIPADGGLSDTIRVYFVNQTTCIDSLISKRPVPCPANVNSCTSTSGCLGGNIFDDYNCNGTNNNESGVQGVEIQVYDCDNNLIGTRYSDSDGDWQLCGLMENTNYRVEFVLPAAIACWAAPTHTGANNATDIQFTSTGDCIDYGLMNYTECRGSSFQMGEIMTRVENYVNFDSILYIYDVYSAGSGYQFRVMIPFFVDYEPAGLEKNVTFCIELEEPFGPNSYLNEYQVIPLDSISRGRAQEDTTASNFIPAGGIGLERAGKVKYLFDNYYLGTDSASWTVLEGVAFQLSVWELSHDDDFELDDTDTNFRIDTSFAITANSNTGQELDAINLAQSWLDQMNGISYTVTDWENYQSSNWDVTALEVNLNKAPGTIDNQDIITATRCHQEIEIGNYIWCDALENGIQDACEQGVNGIIVQLYDRNGILIGQDTTSNWGQYFFNENNADTTGITLNTNGEIIPNSGHFTGISYSSQYSIVFGGGQFVTDNFIIGSDTFGISSIINAGNNDNIDSDVDGNNLTTGNLGTRPDGLPFIDVTTPVNGCGDHKYDMGLTCTIATNVEDVDYADYKPENGCSEPACHIISDDIYLGNGVTPDSNPTGGANADTDEDDGVSLSPKMQFVPGNTVRIPVSIYNNTGNSAYLRIWIDWNGDGDFEDIDEQVENNSYSATGATTNKIFVSVTIPTTAIQTQPIALRARLSTDGVNSTPPCGTGICAADGEVEDYLINVSCPTLICPPVQLNRKH